MGKCPQWVHVLTKQHISNPFLWYLHGLVTNMMSLFSKELLKIFITNRNGLQIIIAHRVSEAMHIKISRTLEDPEQRP